MKMTVLGVRLGSIALTFLSFGFGVPVQAASFSISAFDQGWYSNDGQHTPSNLNVLVGKCASCAVPGPLNNFFAFNLLAVAGQSITSASIEFFGDNLQRYFSPDASETFALFDYSNSAASINSLLLGTAGVAGHSDLGSGSSYGQAIISGTFNAPMPTFSIVLNAAALADLNAVSHSSDLRFVAGGSLTSLSGLFRDEGLFAGAPTFPAARLIIETTDVSAVPGPVVGAGLPSLVMALGGFLAWRRRKALAA